MSEHIDDVAGAYALGSLDPEDAARVGDHIAECAECTAQVRQMLAVVDALPLGLPSRALPAGLRERVMAVTSQVTGETSRPADEQTARGAVLPFRRRANTRRWSAAAGAVALAAIVLLAILLARQGVSSTAIEQYRQLVAQARSGGDQVTDMSILTGSTRMRASIDQPSQGAARLLLGPSTRPAAGTVYELWFIRTGAQPVRMVVVSPSPSAAKTVALSRGTTGYNTAAMSVEPGPDGTAQPTTTPFAAVELASSTRA